MTKVDRDQVMAALLEGTHALHVTEICQRLSIPKRERDSVLDVLDELAELSMVTQLPGLRFRAKKKKKSAPARPPRKRNQKTKKESPSAYRPSRNEGNLVKGRITVHPRGFAFVAAEDGGPDVFVPPEKIGASLHQDRVLVRAFPSRKGRDGEVVEVLRRRVATISGKLIRKGSAGYLEPDDIRLPPRMYVRGPLPKDAKNGLSVVCKIVVFPQFPGDELELAFEQVLGTQGVTTVEVAKIKVREGIVEEFNEAVMDEMEFLPSRVTPKEREGRIDLREFDLCTIDPADARDHDDALWAERTKNGFHIIVAIADVAHYVREGTATDQEALERCTSIYLPDRAIPMLPHAISTNLASLVANKDRLCMAVEVWMDNRGKVTDYRFLEGVMRSGAGLHYEGVARALGLLKSGPRQPQAEKRTDTLNVMLEVARILRKLRQRRGSLDFDLPEARIKLDKKNIEPIDSVQSRKDPGIREAYRLVEEFMLLANEVVAAHFAEEEIPTLYRNHGLPDENKIDVFCRLANALGFELEFEQAINPRSLAKFLSQIEGHEQASVLRYLLLRAMQQAVYETTPGIGHFGLAAKHYLHFTSPIRRYPDLVVHRLLKKIIQDEPIDKATLKPKLRKAGAEASRLERRAMSVERDVVNLYRVILMQDRIGEEFDAKVSGVDPNGIYVTVTEPYVEMYIPIERVALDNFELDDLGIRVTGTRTGLSFSLGDTVKVRLEEANISDRKLFALPANVSDLKTQPKSARKSKRGDKGRGRATKRSGSKSGSGSSGPSRPTLSVSSTKSGGRRSKKSNSSSNKSSKKKRGTSDRNPRKRAGRKRR